MPRMQGYGTTRGTGPQHSPEVAPPNPRGPAPAPMTPPTQPAPRGATIGPQGRPPPPPAPPATSGGMQMPMSDAGAAAPATIGGLEGGFQAKQALLKRAFILAAVYRHGFDFRGS